MNACDPYWYGYNDSEVKKVLFESGKLYIGVNMLLYMSYIIVIKKMCNDEVKQLFF
ncbi:hypothetical protein XF24_00182 [candidate division SR1 bacterium Aalborg_AAW-1]|nr:hypothetical protein XF24_00182 [candidate division SR1 bacterium Aalborg_AAW-1]